MGYTDRTSSMANADEVVVERLPPDEAFELLAHGTRLRVLETLNESAEPLVFGELRERVGVSDPGGFNYHLRKLTGRFVRETDEGYELTIPGRRVVGAVLSGGYTKVLDAEPLPVSGTCSECDGSLEARFHKDGIEVVCQNCGFQQTDPKIPAGALEGWSREDAPAVVARWLKRIHAAAEYGFCYNCDGRLDRTVTLPADEGSPEWLTGEHLDATVIYECRRCGTGWQSVVPYAILTHPAVVVFHYDHGIDLREIPDWNLDWPEIGLATVVNETPLRIEVPITLDDETRVFTVDADLDIVNECHE
jgi:hypothetical protein